MIIYIYQGMMALGKGGSIMRELRRETRDREVGVRNIRRNCLGSNKSSKVAPTKLSLMFPTSRRY